MNITQTFFGADDVIDYGWDASDSGSSSYVNPKVISMVAGYKPKRILDIGCGNGLLCKQLKLAGYDVVGVEYDRTGVEIARKTYPDIPFYRFGVQDDPAELLRTEAPFDMVISTEVVEHLFAPHLLVSYSSAVLTSKGILLLSTPFHGYWKNLLLAILGKWDSHHMPLWHGGHVKFWSRVSLGSLLIEGGFDFIDFQGVGRFRHFWKSMVLVGRKLT